MAFPDPLSGGIREDHLPPGYVFYGEEDYLADEFVHKLRKALISPGRLVWRPRFLDDVKSQ